MNEDCPHCVFEKTEANCRGCFEGSHYKPKPVTNADRIVSKSPEELATYYFTEFFRKVPYCHENCPEHNDCQMCLLNWLREEVTE